VAQPTRSARRGVTRAQRCDTRETLGFIRTIKRINPKSEMVFISLSVLPPGEFLLLYNYKQKQQRNNGQYSKQDLWY